MNIVKPLSKLTGWFHREEETVERVFVRIEPLIIKAEPIIKAISAIAAIAATATGNPLLAMIAKYLGTLTTDLAAVDTFVTANQNAPVDSVLHNAAAFALSVTHGDTATTIRDLDLAVQTAFSVGKEPRS